MYVQVSVQLYTSLRPEYEISQHPFTELIKNTPVSSAFGQNIKAFVCSMNLAYVQVVLERVSLKLRQNVSVN